MKTKQFLFLAGLIVLSMVFQPTFVSADVPEAVDYLQDLDQVQNPWIIQALVAVDELGLIGDLDHLKNVTSENAIDYCAPILAITALGENPRTYPNTNYITDLKNFWDGTQLGNSAYLNDDIFGLLALLSSGESTSNSVVVGIKDYLISNQNADDGWGFLHGSSDVDFTAMTIMALVEAGVSEFDSIITAAVGYLESKQNDDGGFPSGWSSYSNASSDAWAISAIYALGQNPEEGDWVSDSGHNPVEHLKSLQNLEDGWFHNTPGLVHTGFTPTETAYAVIALSVKSFPVGYFEVPAQGPALNVHLVIRGEAGIICDTDIGADTALNTVVNAAGICGYTYNIQDTDFGLYLNKIANDTAEGMIGWLYYVNTESPMVGAGDYVLSQGDEVLWYYGEWGWENIVLGEGGNSEVAVTVLQPISITVPDTVTDATINVSALKTDNGSEATATLPEITLNVTTSLSATPVEVVIPADTVITAPAGWDGVINVPKVESNDSITATPDSGNTATVSSVIEIGYGDTELLFSKAVRLLIPEAAGKYVGYSRNGNFTQITEFCGADTQEAGNTLTTGGNCKIDAEADMAIWTKHFTKFVAYTQTAIPLAIPQTTQSGGAIFIPATDCQSVEYDEWQDVCVDGWQYRNVLSQIPSNCALTEEQENQRKRQCVNEAGGEPIVEEETIEEELIFEEEPIVLGVEFISDDQETKKETAKILNTEDSDSIIINETKLIASGDVNQVISAMNVKRDLTVEKNYNKTIVAEVIADSGITAELRNTVVSFVTYGTETTKVLGAGERAGAINSYRSAFHKLPITEAEWNDCLKIANGYLPNQTNVDAENRAIKIFKEVYLRDADRINVNDDLAVKILAYGLRLSGRDLDKERDGLKVFQGVYGYNPSSATDWDCIRAIAYSGAER